VLVDNKDVTVRGKFPRIARLQAEYYQWLERPAEFVSCLKSAAVGADLFTFVQQMDLPEPRYDYYFEWESIAVLPVSSYEHWWKRQINDKTRNMIRRAQKSGVEIRLVDFDDRLIEGIKEIYDESPLRQGKPFSHYRKSLAELKQGHGTFLETSQFLGAFYREELIGFIKLTHGEGVSHVMQILAKIEHRDKAPVNALIAKSVEICAQRGVPRLHYATWTRRGLGDFKKHHAFERFDLPRYYVPLNVRGKLLLKLRLHREISELLPEKYLDFLLELRGRWNMARHRQRT
jgi:hypothetical protein